MKPVRVQRSRRKGSRLTSPNGLPVVCVSRPGIWGNPFVADVYGIDLAIQLYEQVISGGWNPSLVAALSDELVSETYKLHYAWLQRFRKFYRFSRGIETAQYELRGKNLACWCKPGDTCHADVLLRIANSTA